MTYNEWMKRPESERNAEAATVVMGWKHGTDCFGHDAWMSADNKIRDNFFWYPGIDRNATDMLLAEVERREKQFGFAYALGCHNDDSYRAIRSGPGHAGSALGILRIDPSLLTWAAIEACREDA